MQTLSATDQAEMAILEPADTKACKADP